MATLADHLASIGKRMALACQRVGRDAADVRLVAVSKTQPALRVQEAVAAGQWLFGENRLQEAREKIPLLPPACRWHLIGTLQRNKVREAVGLFHMIESVDTLDLAREIHLQARQPMPILVQVNIGREPQKHGFPPEALANALEIMAGFANLRVQGLMTIPPMMEDPEACRPFFRELAALAQTMAGLPGIAMTELSMGMSHDFEVAIEEGATLVRVGSAIFGSRVLT